MSRKTKTQKPVVKPVSPHAMDIASLVMQADAALAASRYKEALDLYKELIKRERQPVWVDGLASCYAGRARELAAKSMFKEALVLWRNRTQLCGKTLAEEPYFSWLLQAGEQEELFQLLSSNTLTDAAQAELETRLASTVLTTDRPNLHADSALMRHRPAVLAALSAYHRGDFAALDEQLQTIPFRSPYKDLKPALKALALLHTDPSAAPAAIARLPADGPFERLIAVLRGAVTPNWLGALCDLNEDSRHLLLDIKGYPDTLRPLLLELSKLGETPAATALYELLLRHRRLIPEDKFKNLFRRLMPHLGQREFDGADFARLPEEEKVHIVALLGEMKGGFEAAEPNWIKMANFLSAQPGGALRAALIWRHVAKFDLDFEDSMNPLDYLKKSLELDPEDSDTTLTVIRALRTDNKLTGARTYLERALSIFPKDAGVLLEAVEVALAGKAYKKAVGLAKQVLTLDPINPKVRGLIGHALLHHARKQIKTRNYLAAHKELDAAQEWLRAQSEFATLKLLRALATEKPAPEALNEAVAGFGAPLTGAFHLLLEAGYTGLNPKALLLKSGIELAQTPTPEAVVALAKRLNAGVGEEKLLGAALESLRGSLKRAAREKFTAEDYLLVCEALQRIEENQLFTVFAEAALKHWPDRPVFVYLSVVSRYGDHPYDIPMQKQYALDKAAKDARKQGDMRTASRIGMLLMSSMDDDDDDDDDDMPFFGEELDDSFPGSSRLALEMVLAISGEKVFMSMVSEILGNQVFNALKKQFGGNQKEFVQKLIDLIVTMPNNNPPPKNKKRPSN
jgi:tetratricopeptide (TPR) repeat protein